MNWHKRVEMLSELVVRWRDRAVAAGAEVATRRAAVENEASQRDELDGLLRQTREENEALQSALVNRREQVSEQLSRIVALESSRDELDALLRKSREDRDSLAAALRRIDDHAIHFLIPPGVTTTGDGSCASCGTPWPCEVRRTTEQAKEILAARDAAQRRAGAVAVLKLVKDGCQDLVFTGKNRGEYSICERDVCILAVGIERGEVTV